METKPNRREIKAPATRFSIAPLFTGKQQLIHRSLSFVEFLDAAKNLRKKTSALKHLFDPGLVTIFSAAGL